MDVSTTRLRRLRRGHNSVDRVRSRSSCRLLQRQPAELARRQPRRLRTAALSRTSRQLTQQERNRQLKNQQLIDTVEQAYQAGVDNYHAGHLEAAKASFDYAVDQMLSSGLDLKNDPQISAEFEHIVDAINTLEMDALKQGNGFEPRD